MLGNKESEEGKLYLYMKLKSAFRTEPYLQHIKQFKFRRAMTMFRISAHRLEIETDHANMAISTKVPKCSIPQ